MRQLRRATFLVAVTLFLSAATPAAVAAPDTRPPRPTYLGCYATGATSIRCDWLPTRGPAEATYRIRMKYEEWVSTAGTSAAFNDLDPGQTYEFALQYCPSGPTGKCSKSLRTAALTLAAPLSPANFRCVSMTSFIQCSWTPFPPAKGAFYRYRESEPARPWVMTSVSTLTILDGIVRGQSYELEVQYCERTDVCSPSAKTSVAIS